jgi:hypothetical protein
VNEWGSTTFKSRCTSSDPTASTGQSRLHAACLACKNTCATIAGTRNKIVDTQSYPQACRNNDALLRRKDWALGSADVGVCILSFIVLEDWFIRLEREDGLPRIVVRRLASSEEHVIAFAEEAYSLGINGGYEFATNFLRFIYSSMTTPEED